MSRAIRRLATLAAAVTISSVAIPPLGVDAASDIPWRYRPITVGSGFTQGNAPTTNGLISKSGRWFAFRSDASNLVPNDTNGVADLFLRDRWTDTTTRLVENALPTAMSKSGRFVGYEVQPTAADPTRYGFILDRDTSAVIPLRGRPIAINNDGWIRGTIVTTFGSCWVAKLEGTVLQDKGTCGPDIPTVVTPSQAFGAGNYHGVHRTDLRTGARIDMPIPVTQYPVGSRPRAISENGRFVLLLTESMGPSIPGVDFQSYFSLWDVTAGTVRTFPNGPTYPLAATFGAVLNDGRAVVQFVDWNANVPGYGSPLWLWRPDGSTQRIDGLTGDVAANGHAPSFIPSNLDLAADINRFSVCTPSALSSFDTNGLPDCYLVQIPD